jgi:hypothetical protein
MPPHNTNDPKHWRERAAQMRALALTMKDPETVILMNDLAADYEKLADRAARKIEEGKSPAKESRRRPPQLAASLRCGDQCNARQRKPPR